MKPSKEKGNANVYMDFVNYQGDVIDSTLIAVLRNRNYANVLVAELDALKEENETFRYRIEVIE
jgi:hypothetical protein